MASDRRLTWDDGTHRDGFVKAILTPGLALTYTGVATLGGDTAKWIARHLTRHALDPDGGLEPLAKLLGRTFAHPRYEGRRHAVLACGWIKQETAFQPCAGLVSNFDPWNQGAGEAWPEFRTVYRVPNPMSLPQVVPLGASMRRSESVSVVRSIERLCSSRRGTVRAVAQVLAEGVRTVSRATSRDHDSRPPTVSEEVLVVALPRPDLRRSSLIVGQLRNDYCSVTSTFGSGSRLEAPGGPILVGPGAAIRALEPHESPGSTEAAGVAMEILCGPPSGGHLSCFILTNPPVGPAWGWPGIDPKPTCRRAPSGM